MATARGSELEVAYAWGVVRQLLEPRLRGMSAAARGRTLAGAAALAEPIVLPGDAPPAVDADPTFGVLHGLYWLVAALADAATAPARRRRPALGRRRLDPVPRVPREPARRAAGAAARGPAAARRTARSAGRRSRPRSSSPRCRSPATAAVLAERDGAPVSASFAEACHAATGGNPLLVRRLAEGLRDRERCRMRWRGAGPDAVAGAVGATLARLGDGPTRLARAVAVLEQRAARHGRPAGRHRRARGLRLRRAARARRDPARRPSARVRARARPRRRAGRAHGGRALAAARRRRAHARGRGRRDRRRSPSTCCTRNPQGDERVADTLAAAGRRALGSGALNEAAACLARALAEPPAAEQRSALLLDLARAENGLGRPEALDHVLEASDCRASTRSTARTPRSR